MPAPSKLAKRLADDLVEMGKMFGFEATIEQRYKRDRYIELMYSGSLKCLQQVRSHI